MKQWKYIKGSEKDFEGAPHWALSVCQGSLCLVFYEQMIGLGHWQNKSREKEEGYDDVGGLPLIAQRELIEIWDGQGLPTVGTVCQWNNGNEWTTVNVLGINGNEVWVKPEDGSESFVVNDDDFKLLPDERDLAVQQMFYDLPENIRPGKDVREAIYDAGYRKVKPLPDENQTIKQIADMIGKGSTALEDADYIYRSIISGLINTPCRCDS